MTVISRAPEVPSPATAVFRRVGPNLAVVGLVTLVLAVAAITTDGFFTTDNARAILLSASIVGVVAVAMTPITLSGNLVSLAVQQMTILATIMYLAMARDGMHWLAALAAVVVAMVVVGVLQGAVVALGMNPIVTTLAAGAIIFGVLASYTNGRAVTATGPLLAFVAEGSLFGIPVAVYAFLLFTLLAQFYVTGTVLGRQTLLVGSNREVARNSGLPIATIIISAFVVLALGTALAGLLTAGQIGQATPSDLGGLTFDVIAAILVGGTAIQGGEGSPLRSAFGAIVIACFNNIMVLNGLSIGPRLTFTGVLVATVVLLLHVTRKGTR
ncbi:ABC transporter permease [Rhodococcus jostii]|uniref:ABC transporter permease n=1 Tax=Rhodococcus jostii TaxID=132919 RepID=UPI00364F0660